MAGKKTLYITISAALSIVLLWLLFSQIKTPELIQTLRQIYVPALFAYMGIALMAAVLRALRYKWLLRPYKIGWGNMMLVTFIRNSFVDLLPARLGALSYVYVLNRRLDFSFESATSSFVLSGIFDFLTLSPFLLLALLAVGLGSIDFSRSRPLGRCLCLFSHLFYYPLENCPVFRFASQNLSSRDQEIPL